MELSATEVAKMVREERLRQNLTPAALARKAGVSRATFFYSLEAGEERPRQASKLARVALALGKPWTWLGAAVPADIPPGRGYKLCEARLAHGLSLSELSKASMVTRQTIYKLEHGGPGSPLFWDALSRALETEL